MSNYGDIPGHFSFADVYDLALETSPNPAEFVEIGSWLGASAAYMAAGIRSSDKQIKFSAVDNFTAIGSMPSLRAEAQRLGGNFYELFRSNLRKYDLLEFVTPIVGDSTQSAALFKDGTLDFVYIDAAHDYIKVKQDIEAWLPKVRVGGILAGHDYDATHPGVVRAVNEIFGKQFTIMTHSWLVRP